ncbi:long-chain acyl-CoA synthetase [Murinocardiopsis flavida]|uniref:Acyl-CoA synthetase n=1 Tax=Murinocardiopsis flavida TaxID=645275 RepID=A0A2P8DSL7_9ACTN|nr:AMP-dependent synthetase/ligase [Murinocardiopsis flavida]PSL00207.1 long-chain acyl-CoA synthetase [Murinocardiopsis flavida]
MDATEKSRQEVDAEIDGMTLVDWLRDTAQRDPDAPALSEWTGATTADGQWQTTTWGAYRQTALDLAAAFIDAGAAPGDIVALMLPNCAAHLMADLGAVHAGAVPLSVYSTFAPDQIGHVAADCAATVAVLAGADELARWEPVLDRLPALHTVVLCDAASVPAPGTGSGPRFVSWDEFLDGGRRSRAADPGPVERRMAALTPDHNATLLYTSGTTGAPKGVFETHHQVLYQVTVSHRTSPMARHSVSLSYLPLAHIAERVLSVYLPIKVAGHIHFCPDPRQLGMYLGMVRPHGLFGVPRVWEKLRAGLSGALAAASEEQRAAVEAAADTARAYVLAGQRGATPPDDLARRFAAADEQVLAPIRALVGLDRAEHLISAAAPMPVDVLHFFAGLGCVIRDVYGMTENCGAATANRMGSYAFGSVGRPVDGIEVRAADDGELLIRGPINTAGYHNLPDATAALIDPDGWLHTGDIGSVDDDGFVYVVDRKKELIITAGGENIAPAEVENLLKEHPLVGQALAYADRRPYLVALLVLDAEAARAWADTAGLDARDPAALAEHPAVLAEVGRAVEAANTRLSRIQQVKRWLLLPVEWTAESEELTPSLKLKRRVIQRKYAGAIDALYDE